MLRRGKTKLQVFVTDANLEERCYAKKLEWVWTSPCSLENLKPDSPRPGKRNMKCWKHAHANMWVAAVHIYVELDVRTRPHTHRHVRLPLQCPKQCPYSVHTVSVHCLYSVRTQCPYRKRIRNQASARKQKYITN